jgi:hypothetical protein
MNANEMAQKLSETGTFEGLDIFANTRYNTVEVYGFNQTADWKATKAALEALGFDCSPNAGTWEGEAPKTPSIREQYEQMSGTEKAQADATFNKMVRS